MTRYRYFLGAIVLAVILGLSGCQGQSQQTSEKPQTVTVTRGDLNATVNAAGVIQAHTVAAVPFQTSGQVQEIYVQVGDAVKAGQKLAQLDTTELENSVTTAQFNLDSARLALEETRAGPSATELANARASVEMAEANYKAALARYNLRGDQQTAARAQLDRAAVALQNARFAYEWTLNDWLRTPRVEEAKKDALDKAQEAYDQALRDYNATLVGINDTALRSAEAQLASARANLDTLENTPTPENLRLAELQVRQAELALQQAQLNLSRATLIAPIDGIVTAVNIQAGQTVGTGAAAVTIADMARLEISVSLPEIDIASVQTGQDAIITIDALGGKTLQGKVTLVSLVGQTVQNVVSYPATIELVEHDPDVRLGMNASVSIIIDRRQNVLLVPNRAIRTSGRQRTVTVYYQGETITLPVTVGLVGDTHTEILSGVREGDLIVINPTTTTTRRQVSIFGGLGRFLGGGR